MSKLTEKFGGKWRKAKENGENGQAKLQGKKKLKNNILFS